MVRNLQVSSDSLLAPPENVKQFSRQTNKQAGAYRQVLINLTAEDLAQDGYVEILPISANLNRLVGFTGQHNQHMPRLVKIANFSNLLASAEGKEAKEAPEWLKKFEIRCQQLRESSKEDDIELREKSLKQAEKFAKSSWNFKLPSVFLSTNGNVRLVWGNAKSEQVALQFLGDGRVQYIFFRNVDDGLDQIMGVCQISTVQDLICRVGLGDVIGY